MPVQQQFLYIKKNASKYFKKGYIKLVKTQTINEPHRKKSGNVKTRREEYNAHNIVIIAIHQIIAYLVALKLYHLKNIDILHSLKNSLLCYSMIYK